MVSRIPSSSFFLDVLTDPRLSQKKKKKNSAYDYALLERDLENVDYHDELLKATRETGGESVGSHNDTIPMSQRARQTTPPEMEQVIVQAASLKG
jgi:hypothetical protein